MSFKKADKRTDGKNSFKAYCPTDREIMLEDKQSCESLLKMMLEKHKVRLLNILTAIHSFSNKNKKGAHLAALVFNIEDSDVGSNHFQIYYCIQMLKEFGFVYSKTYWDTVHNEKMEFLKLKNEYIGKWATKTLLQIFDHDEMLAKKIKDASEHKFDDDYFVEMT